MILYVNSKKISWFKSLLFIPLMRFVGLFIFICNLHFVDYDMIMIPSVTMCDVMTMTVSII